MPGIARAVIRGNLAFRNIGGRRHYVLTDSTRHLSRSRAMEGRTLGGDPERGIGVGGEGWAIGLDRAASASRIVIASDAGDYLAQHARNRRKAHRQRMPPQHHHRHRHPYRGVPRRKGCRVGKGARENILRDKTIGPLYRKYIDHIGVGQGSRNTKLCQVAGFAHDNFAPDIAFRLGMALYDVNADRFIDSREQHEGELIAILSDADRRWRERLSPSEREVIDGLDEERTAAYRICRTLAGIANDFPPPLFHLSCEELGKRIGKHGQQSHRILESFVAHRILAIHQKGTRREAGARGVATVYRWLQPLPDVPKASAPAVPCQPRAAMDARANPEPR